MGSRVEDLLNLAKMLDEGKVSQEEYEVVKAELLAAPAEEWLDPAVEPPEEMGEPGVPADDDSADIADESSGPDLASVIQGWIRRAKELPAHVPLGWGCPVGRDLGAHSLRGRGIAPGPGG